MVLHLALMRFFVYFFMEAGFIFEKQTYSHGCLVSEYINLY